MVIPVRLTRSSGRHYAAHMIRMLLRAVVFVVSAAIGLLVAAAVVDGVRVTASGLLVAAETTNTTARSSIRIMRAA